MEDDSCELVFSRVIEQMEVVRLNSVKSGAESRGRNAESGQGLYTETLSQKDTAITWEIGKGELLLTIYVALYQMYCE